MTRTSLTHALYINEVDVPATGGRIGMTLFPGRRDELSPGGPWARDLAIDLEKVRTWNPAIVITLVEEFEYSLLGVPDYGERMRAYAQAQHIAWMHLPIRDVGVPDARFEAAWVESGRAARTALRAGRKVLLHCRAGLGRTGMIAARLLVEVGVPADEAIASVRSARYGTIQTGAQERHVRSQSALEDVSPGA